jgi:hypothetical protein
MHAGEMARPLAAGISPRSSGYSLQKDREENTSLVGGGGGEGTGKCSARRWPEKVSSDPTWALFAVSGLAAWLIDNWPRTSPFAFC